MSIEVRAEPVRRAGVALPLAVSGLFLLSGASGLMYEVVWVRMLGRVLGNTVYATSGILAAFMAGLAVGSYAAGRIVDRSRRPLLWYAVLEMGVAAAALLSLGLAEWPAPLYRALYEWSGQSRAWLTAGQVALSSAALLLPTALMGATLPTLSAFVTRRGRLLGRSVGTLYALITLGAMAGVLASGFVLLGDIGETRTVLCGVALNVLVAFAALVVATKRAPGRAEPDPPRSDDPGAAAPEAAYPAYVGTLVVACFAASGFAALACEVVWSRMLVLQQGTAIYAFSSMLGVVLGCMGLGTLLSAAAAGRSRDPLRQLAATQLLISLSVLVGLALFRKLGADADAGYFLPPLLVVGPAAFLWGVAFPLAVRCHVRSRASAGRRVGELYAWNTVGCILGSLAGGFVLIPLLGVGASAKALALVSVALGAVLLAGHPAGLRKALKAREVALAAGSVLLLAAVGDPYGEAILDRVRAADPDGDAVVYHHAEDATATTTAFGPPLPTPARSKHLFINGVGMTHLATVTKLMAHLPLWLADDPRESVVICFGMGTTVRSSATHAGLEIWSVELVPAVYDCFEYFHPGGRALLRDPRVHPVVDDGRNFLAMRPRQYDTIVIDPPPPLHSAGAVNLYSREFFELCKSRVRPGGVVCLWVPPDSVAEVRMIMATFADVFPHVGVWAGPPPDVGFYLIGSHRGIGNVWEKVRRGFRDAAADLAEWDETCDSPEKVLALYICDRDELKRFTDGAPIITDDRPYTEFPLWRPFRRNKGAAFLADDLRAFLRAGGR